MILISLTAPIVLRLANNNNLVKADGIEVPGKPDLDDVGDLKVTEIAVLYYHGEGGSNVGSIPFTSRLMVDLRIPRSQVAAMQILT